MAGTTPLVIATLLLGVLSLAPTTDADCTVTNCETCATASKVCKGCYIGVPEQIDYRGSVRLPVPTSGKCNAYNIANCTDYEMLNGNPTGKCNSCVEGYVLNSAGTSCLKCSSAAVFENCGVCASSATGYTCSACKKGYVLKNNVCESCPANCDSCSLDTGNANIVCNVCQDQYGLKPDKSQCVQCLYEKSQGSMTTCPSCSITAAGAYEKCTECTGGFMDSNGKCLDCDALPDCEKCTDDDGDGTPDTCTECREYYGLVNGACSACQATLHESDNECYDCDGSDLTRCSQCYYHSWKRREFWVIRPDATGCTKCMPKCEVCTDTNNDGTADACTQCLNGTRYHLKDGACQDCADTQCSECADETVCTACETGYTLSAAGLSCTKDSGGGGDGGDGTGSASHLSSGSVFMMAATLLVFTQGRYHLIP